MAGAVMDPNAVGARLPQEPPAPPPETPVIRRLDDSQTGAPGLFRGEPAEPRSPLLRSLVWMLVGIGLVGLVLFGAQKYLFNRNSEPVVTDSQTPGPQPPGSQPSGSHTPNVQTADNSGSKPSPVGQSQVPDNPAKEAPAPPAPPEATAPESSTPPASQSAAPKTAPARQEAETPPPQRSQPERVIPSPGPSTEPPPAVSPKPDVGQSVQFLTEPPGAQVTVDGNSSLACKTPCMLPLSGGRHALTVQLAGYRPYPRVFSVPQDGDLFLKLAKASGTLSITSEPPGATIEVDGTAQSQRTPAVFNLPPGTYHIKVARSGAFLDFDVQLRDGEFINKRVDF